MYGVYIWRVFASSIRWWPCADAGGADLAAAVDEWTRVCTDVGVQCRE